MILIRRKIMCSNKHEEGSGTLDLAMGRCIAGT